MKERKQYTIMHNVSYSKCSIIKLMNIKIYKNKIYFITDFQKIYEK